MYDVTRKICWELLLTLEPRGARVLVSKHCKDDEAMVRLFNVSAWCAPCNIRRATCNIRRATCNIRRATCNIRRATCTVHSQARPRLLAAASCKRRPSGLHATAHTHA